MAIVSTLSNHYKYQKMAGAIDHINDTFKIILMNTTFAFDKDAHATLADVSADELATDYGYTQQNKALSGGTLTEDDTGDKAYRTFDHVSWVAASGSIGPTGAACIYDDTTVDKTIVGCIDFGADFTIPDGSTFQIQSPTISDT